MTGGPRSRIAEAPVMPAGRTVSFRDLVLLAESGAVDSVYLAVPDMQGRLKGKLFSPAHFLDHVVPDGAGMCAYLLATDVDMRQLDGYAVASWDTGYGDMEVRPDPGAVHVLPWLPRTALVFGDAFGDDGQPLAVAPRRILRSVVDRLAGQGLTASVGLETEFVLFHGTYAAIRGGDYRELEPVSSRSQDYALDHPERVASFLGDLRRALAGAGLPVEAVKTEGAPGQVEVTFPHGDPLLAADAHLLFKHATRTLGERAGLAPTFMAAPLSGTGSGCHIHLSLGLAGGELFARDDDRTPDAVRHAVGGLLQALPRLAPLYAPTVNSYRRFDARAYAPTNFTWGRDNRSCAVRLVGRGDRHHLEIRLPGADANPYLALAAVLGAVLYGLDDKIDPPPEQVGSAYAHASGVAATPVAWTARPVPTSLDEAVRDFDAGLVEELLGPGIAEHYAQAARHESAAHRTEVTDVDRRRGFDTA
ncbi:glutamine synthetase family protein [Streptomyces sp. NPDC004726]